jgi:hypothetical protein
MTDNIAKLATKLQSGVEARNAEIKTSLQSAFEASSAKLKATLESPSPPKAEAPTKQDSSGNQILSRKPWSWLYRD